MAGARADEKASLILRSITESMPDLSDTSTDRDATLKALAVSLSTPNPVG